MAQASKTVLIVGATGRTGRFATTAMMERGWAVRALVRDLKAATATLPAATELIFGAVEDRSAIAAAMPGVQAVLFTASGGASSHSHPRTVDDEGVAALAEAAAKAGVGHFVLLSSAAVTQPEHPHNCSVRNILKWKLRGERALKAQSMRHTVVRALGLRDREGGLEGGRMVQGDRIAFGEDIARADVAQFLADVVCVGAEMERTATDGGYGFAPDFNPSSLINATLEIYADRRIPPRQWRSAQSSLAPDADTR